MTTLDIPFLGSLVLCLVLVCASYTFVVSVATGRGRPHLLPAARYGALATCGFVAFALFLLAYAFQTHDFQIRYVARYSDRSMPWWYLVASLWGGQDGSLLWWTFLLSGYTVAVTLWMRGRYRELQPWMFATLMTIFGFFCITMLFAANPFATTVGAAPLDGEGLNPLLQNYWMAIHPPSLYMGFVGWSIPFAILVGALITGRLSREWIDASRLWAMVAWSFLSLGLLLGCLWSYEELGWGGYWAWDPVENASFMPWLVGTAFLHSILTQERYGMMRVWNVFLLCLTFFMTIFGTFLTRSGLIASVHSFARSDIGIYFVWYLGFLLIACTALIIWRLPKLRSRNTIDSMLSREFAFLLNNWILLGMMVFVLVATTAPLLSDWLMNEKVTVGPPFYNKWMVPLGIILLLLMGIGPLTSWRKTTGRGFWRAALVPAVFGLVVFSLHVAFGARLGYPPVISSDEIYDTATGRALAALFSVAPLLVTTVGAFVIGTVVQEFWRGVRVRMRSKGESPTTALVRLVSRAKRRYGGYIIHVGIVIMFIGFAGSAYDIEKEAALQPGAAMHVGDYAVRYDGARMELDPSKRMLFTDMTLLDKKGDDLGEISPAKFIYATHPDMPTTEVAIRSRLDNDVYVIMSTVDPSTKRGTFRVIVRPLVAWIWLGGMIVLFGCVLTMSPSVKELLAATKGAQTERRMRRRLAVALTALFLLAFGLSVPALVQAQSNSSSSLMAGTVIMHDPLEKQLFGRLLCQCGDCARLPLTECTCSWAQREREKIRAELAAGVSPGAIENSYRAQFGEAALSVPSDEGFGRAMWALPVTLLVAAGAGIFFVGRRWRRAGDALTPVTPDGMLMSDIDYDRRLDDELRRFEEDA